MTSPVKVEREQRRAQRRAEMVRAAMDAVRAHGPGVSVAEIAAAAGITKPVLYRHFTDRADLQRAVGEQAAALLFTRIAPELLLQRPPVEQIRAAVDAFLAGIEAEPELWRFVVHHPIEASMGEEIAEDVRQRIAAILASLIRERLGQTGRDASGAEAWAQGLVGMVQSAGDWWLERRTITRAALTDHLTALIWGGLAGLAGLDPEGDGDV
ncbi:TetR family transcriptional regulator [Pseudonocardia sp.]|uniref:TetR family transcriptional regulator n=1 Tax=Pseudonocardia sp. TaxID=60912 RepID=UPI003D0BB1FA